MPTVKITLSKQMEPNSKYNLAAGVSALTANILGKPEDYVQVIISDDAVISFAGDSRMPSAFVVVLSIGGLTPENCKKMSSKLCDILEENGFLPERVYINFSEQHPTKWGWNGGTFA